MKNSSRIALLAGLLGFALAYTAEAQTPGRSESGAAFVEMPGETEFTGEMIVRPLQMPDAIEKTGSARRARALRARAALRLAEDKLRYHEETDEYIVRVPSNSDESKYAGKMMATGDYQYVEPNWRVYPLRRPNDMFYGSQWHHQQIRSELAWDITTGSSTQIIAYTDTGIDITHLDLAPNRVPGYNSASDQAELDGGQVDDNHGHGTHVAGIGSAIGDNFIGVCGVGWSFRIMMVRVSNLDSGGATIEDLTQGARWAGENGALSVSTSYSGVFSSSVQTTGEYLNSLPPRGVVYLWAAGNNNFNLSFFDHANVVIVGATTFGDAKASFSNYGTAVDVFAPGNEIFSTYPRNSYRTLSGTSMAAPMANGVVAMIRTMNPTWTVARSSRSCSAVAKTSASQATTTSGVGDAWTCSTR